MAVGTDLKAMIAAHNVAIRRLVELCDRRGVERILRAMKMEIERSEVRFRGRLRALPRVTMSDNSWCVANAPLPRSVDVLLTGAGKFTAAFGPRFLACARSGSGVLTCSTMRRTLGRAHSVVRPPGTGLGLTKAFACELAPFRVSANAIRSAFVATVM